MASTLWDAVFAREVAALSVRHATACDVLRDAVAEFRGAVPGEDQVEPAQD